MSLPVIGITMGDAAGVGPEIIVKALADPEVYQVCRPFVIGDAKILKRAESILRTGVRIRPIQSAAQAAFVPGAVDCLDLDLLPPDLPFGHVSGHAGDAAYRFLEQAVALAKEGAIDAITTAPLNQEAVNKGGHTCAGHTEILADLTGTSDYALMLTAPGLRVIHVTSHVGLIDAIQLITPERVLRVIRLGDETLKRAGVATPRIGVCGINPHAGENGLLGYGEESEKILPAVEQAQDEDIRVHGPLPADELFYRARQGDFDLVVAMYHDQGHIPVKVLRLDPAVNITVGLPIIRTSVDHGTAFDIAGTGKADPSSMREALRQAAALVRRGVKGFGPN